MEAELDSRTSRSARFFSDFLSDFWEVIEAGDDARAGTKLRGPSLKPVMRNGFSTGKEISFSIGEVILDTKRGAGDLQRVSSRS